MVKKFAFGRRVLVTPTQTMGRKEPNSADARKEEAALQALLQKKGRTIGKRGANIPQKPIAYLKKNRLGPQVGSMSKIYSKHYRLGPPGESMDKFCQMITRGTKRHNPP